MISKQKYSEAKKIVEQYEKEQNGSEFLIEMAKIKFPLGTNVVSKLNTAVRGTVTDYRMWSGVVQLICKHGDEKTRMLIHNAVSF